MTRFKFIALLLFAVFAINDLQAQVTTNKPDTGQIIKLEAFAMPQLKRQRTIRVYLPAGYSVSHKTYPVIYMLDGQNLFKRDAAIKSTWGVDSTLAAQALDKQCIVVGVDHAGKDRITEYDPYDSQYGKGDGIAFTSFLVETLKPYIDSHYRTKKGARYTAIAGSSMGSLLAMYAIEEYPDVFGSAGLFSPAFWIAPEIYTLAQNKPVNKISGFYLTCGDKESANMVKQVSRMDSVLMAKNIPAKQLPPLKINAGSVHNELQWRQAFPPFYTWLTARF
ncbi:MAG: alpha/beta hydrolase [Mucilaginibacter sp.]